MNAISQVLQRGYKVCKLLAGYDMQDRCMLCRSVAEPYVVFFYVMEQAKHDRNDRLCLSCLSKRVEEGRGTPLTLEDFNLCPVNNTIRLGFCLGQQARDKSWHRELNGARASR